jgi:glycopeptide antibiotics resistance protein
LLILLWLILFKLSFDVSTVLFNHQARSLNLIPFTGATPGNLREMIDNFVIFIPFGLLLGVNLKQATVWRKLAFVFCFSLAVETLQFVLAIGITDITDVITNTLGGFMGLMLYDLSNKYVDSEKQDRFIVVVGMILLIALVLFRVLVLRVRY